jgi:hypothetical protein
MGLRCDRVMQTSAIKIITFTGAHGIGKSTMIKDIGMALQNRNIRVDVIPSCSQQWFSMHPEVKTYDDINRLGLRQEMQRQLPEILESLLVSSLMKIFQNPPMTSLILVDRWFADIATYSVIELGAGKAAELDQGIGSCYRRTLDRMRDCESKAGIDVYLTHVFTPIASCQHELPAGITAEKTNRATGSQSAWEVAYDQQGSRFCPAQRTLVISTSDRLQRVEEILRRTLNDC